MDGCTFLVHPDFTRHKGYDGLTNLYEYINRFRDISQNVNVISYLDCCRTTVDPAEFIS